MWGQQAQWSQYSRWGAKPKPTTHYPAPAATPRASGEGGVVDQIKELQRNDPVAREQWISYCEQHNEGKRDPMKVPAELIQDFLTMYMSGTRMASELDSLHIEAVTKSLQKKSYAFKEMWAQHCSQHAGGMNDPSKHDSTFHLQFYDTLAQQALSSNSWGQMPLSPGMMDGSAPKRMRNAAGHAVPMAGGDYAKSQLVEKVKAFQRQGTAEKETWWAHCDSALKGARDPSRHDSAVLREFLVSVGVDANDAGSRPSPATDMEKTPLVNRIKAYQKEGEMQKGNWHNACGATRDPARHDMTMLKDFIDTFGVP